MPSRAANAAATPDPAWAAFHARHGAAWELGLDAVSGRPRRLVGGATPLVTPVGVPTRSLEEITALVGAFLRENAALLALDAAVLAPSADGTQSLDGGRFVVVAFDVAPAGVPVLGARVVAVVSQGRLISVHAVGTAPVTADPKPRIGDRRALDVALAAAGMSIERLEDPLPPRLVFLPEDGGHRLAWIVTLIARAGPLRLVAHVDARDGALISLTDQTVSACAPTGGPPIRRALGGVRTERADRPEREELLPFVTAGSAVAGMDGTFVAGAFPYAGLLEGPGANASCVDCSTPAQPLAPAAVSGDVDFGSGGIDEIGNGLATPSDRAAFFHAEGTRRHAARWLDVPFTRNPVRIHSNIDAACNAFWDGSSLNFFRTSVLCANTGEIRGIVAHEWGHGLDHGDGQPASPLEVDGATGEAVADVVAILRSRDACIGDSFFRGGGGPSAACSGVRDVDELAGGHELGSPATLTTANAIARCPPSAYYRGPLGREGHCEGQIFGQAFWHLVQDLRTGRSYADGTPLAMDPLSEEQAWDVAERLFYLSRPIMASYAPSHLQGIGMSAHDAFLLADDEGDGIASGTPHAAAIDDAFAHHGITESGLAPPDTPDCVAPADPVVGVVASGDPESGLPALIVSWSDVGTPGYRVLRADDPDDAFLTRAVVGPGAGMFVDRGVLPGRAYRYRVVAQDASGCLSASPPIAGTPGALLRIANVRVDDRLPGGNADGTLAEGETADVYLDLANDGAADAGNAVVSLGTSDPALVVLGPASMAYGTIRVGSTVPAPGAFQVRVGTGTPRFTFLVASAETDDGCLRDASVVEIAARDLRLQGWRIDDPLPGGDGDGSFRSGEQVSLVVSLRDDGLLDASAVDGTIAFDGAPPAGITIVDATATWPALVGGGPAAETDAPHFVLRAGSGLPPRTRVPLRLVVRIGGVFHREFSILVIVGAFPPAQREWGTNSVTWSTPLVIPLRDTDGDGLVTACDVPAIVFAGEDDSGATGVFALSGDGGAPLWSFVTSDDCTADTRPCTVAPTALAAGDLDGDGLNEIVIAASLHEVTALTSTGAIFWTAPDSEVIGEAAVQIVDLDADGRPEVIVGASVFDGATGILEQEFPAFSTGRSIIADLDLDGLPEVIIDDLAGTTFHGDGTPSAATFPGFEDFGAAVNIDDDPFPEIVYTHGTSLTAREHDGTLVFERTDIPAPIAASPPCFGDFDGDGRAETAFATYDEFRAYGEDGALLWAAPLQDHSGMSAGCSLFDFDGDGTHEIVFRNTASLSILDARDGEILWQVPAVSSTFWETPVIADVDADGSAEIVLSYTRIGPWTEPQALHVFGNPQWLPARAIWNQEAYTVTNVEEDGGIPRLPAPSWLAGNDFKAQSGAGPCACGLEDPSFTFTVPDCTNSLLCFAAFGIGSPSGGISWDFGDGSPPVPGETPCHEFPGPGDYPVRLTIGADLGCAREIGRMVSVRVDLAAGFRTDPQCAHRPTCVTSDAAGGVAPLELAWDFGDGTPLETGAALCHVYVSGGAMTITHFVRDADRCLLESSSIVDIIDPATLPEVSPRGSASPLLVAKSGGALRLSFEPTVFTAGVYRGLVADLRVLGYTHESTGECRLSGSGVTLPLPADDSYYLVVASACEGPREGGPFGFDSFASPRPSAGALGLPACP